MSKFSFHVSKCTLLVLFKWDVFSYNFV